MNLTIPNRYRIAVSSFYFIQGLIFASWASRIPDVKTALQLNDAALGSVLFAIPVGQLSAMALSGYLVSRFGSRKILMLGVLLYIAGLIGLGLVTTAWTLSVGLFFFGIAANLCNISVNTQGVGVERLYGRSIMATFHGLWSLAGFAGGLISTWVVGYDMSPFSHFCMVGGFCLLLLLLMRSALLPGDEVRKPEKQEKVKSVFVKPDRYIILLGVIAFGNMVCEGTMFDWSGVYFEQVIDPPKEWVRLGYIACMCTMACGRFIADKLVIRFGVVPVIRTSGLIIASGLLLAVLFPYLLTATIGFLLVGFGISSTVPICYSLAGKSKIMLPGVALATVSTIGFLGFLLGPPVIGFIAQALNLRWAFAIIACIGIMTTLLAPALKRCLKDND